MARLQFHLAAPDEKRAIAATVTHLSGFVTGHSIALVAIPGSPGTLWNVANGQNAAWWLGLCKWLEGWVANVLMTQRSANW